MDVEVEEGLVLLAHPQHPLVFLLVVIQWLT